MSADMQPPVSVCLPTYNRAALLPQAIRSVLEQDYPHFELLIVDNCSIDDTAEVVTEFARMDARIRYVRNDSNLGMVGNFNRCLELARYDLIKFLCSDDRFHERHALGCFVTAMHDPEVVLAASARRVVDADDRHLSDWCTYAEGDYSGQEIQRDCLFTAENRVGEPTAAIFRKTVAIRGFDPEYHQLMDLEMWFHLLKSGRFRYIQSPLVVFRQHQGQLSEINRLAARSVADEVPLIERYAHRPLVKFPPLIRQFLILLHCRRLWLMAQAGQLESSTARQLIEQRINYRVFLFLNRRLLKSCRNFVHRFA